MTAPQPLFCVFVPRGTRPSTLQIITDIELEPAHAFAFKLDYIAVHEAAETTMVCASRQNITRNKRVDRCDPLDTARDVMSHIISVEVLLHLAIDVPLLHR